MKDELMEIIEGLKTNERFLALPYFPIEEDENTFVWNVEKTPFYKGARDGLGYMPILPIRMPSITHNVVDGYSFVTEIKGACGHTAPIKYGKPYMRNKVMYIPLSVFENLSDRYKVTKNLKKNVVTFTKRK